jgi:predicted nuclease of restriction endonuclease-like (RecB) superfamily
MNPRYVLDKLKMSECAALFFLIEEIEHLGVLTQIPWSHNIILMEKIDSIEQRLWYATKTIENKWGKRALEDWIERDIYSRQGKAATNFSLRLPEPQSTLAKETLCDPYFFEFLNLPPGHLKKELENGLVEKIQETLLAFGHGFAFVGRQYPLEIDGDTFYIDLLFYCQLVASNRRIRKRYAIVNHPFL